MVQLQLLRLDRTEEERVAAVAAARTELIDLMARVLMAVFQTKARRIDERTAIQSKDQAGTLGS
ncbi:MAG: hypothetical protein M3Y72_14075 [Acidobacteriota bacterium]|nr:hypothetical protein [Acidobacteriota bacterium]